MFYFVLYISCFHYTVGFNIYDVLYGGYSQ